MGEEDNRTETDGKCLYIIRNGRKIATFEAGKWMPLLRVSSPQHVGSTSIKRHRWSRIMAKIARQLTIGDYAKWRAGFDKAAPFREKAGMKNTQVYRDVDNPTDVLIWSEVDGLAKARAILDSPEVRNAMREAGVVGDPKIHVIP